MYHRSSSLAWLGDDTSATPAVDTTAAPVAAASVPPSTPVVAPAGSVDPSTPVVVPAAAVAPTQAVLPHVPTVSVVPVLLGLGALWYLFGRKK